MIKAILLLNLWLLALPIHAAGDWVGWRGGERTGVYKGPVLPTHWNQTKNIRWRTPLQSPGASSPIISGDRIFLTQSAENSASVLSLSQTTGKVLWQVGLMNLRRTWTVGESAKGSPTPVTDGVHVYALLGQALQCLSFEGEEKWLRELGDSDPARGLAASPVLFGNLCIVNLLNPPRLAAFDKRTGEPVWSAALSPAEGGRELAWNDPLRVSNCTPLLLKTKGLDAVVLAVPGQIRAWSPSSGSPLWSAMGFGEMVESSPLWAEGALIGKAASPNGGTAAIRLGSQTPSMLWTNGAARGDIGSGVVRGRHAYFVGDSGNITCLELKTGKVVNQRPLALEGHPSGGWFSLLLAGGLIYAPHASGAVVLVQAEPGLRVLATNSVDEPLGSALAASDGQLFLRTRQTLWCVATTPKSR